MDSSDRPTADVYTNEWYRQQFQSLNYHWQRSMAEEAELTVQVKLLRKQVAEMESARTLDMAKIGELTDRLDKASTVIKEIRAKVNGKATV